MMGLARVKIGKAGWQVSAGDATDGKATST
jgi:hypothetical protein